MAKKDTPTGALPPRFSWSLSLPPAPQPRADFSHRVLPAGLARRGLARLQGPEAAEDGQAHTGGSWLLRFCPVDSSVVRCHPRCCSPTGPAAEAGNLRKTSDPVPGGSTMLRWLWPAQKVTERADGKDGHVEGPPWCLLEGEPPLWVWVLQA